VRCTGITSTPIADADKDDEKDAETDAADKEDAMLFFFWCTCSLAWYNQE
jgi:hypothetical protein